MVTWLIRPAEPDDVDAIREVEIDADTRFGDVGPAAVVTGTPRSAQDLLERVLAGRCWVAVAPHGDGDEVLGYATASRVDDHTHLDQVSVATSSGRRGVGSALVERVHSWAQRQGHDTVTLTTYADIAWNRPFYEQLGYRVVDGSHVGPDLAAIIVDEHDAGLDVAPRVVMRRLLAGRPGGDDRAGRDPS